MIGRLLLLASAYSPLPLLIGIRDHNTHQSWLLIAAAAVLAGALPLWWAVRTRYSAPRPARVVSTEPTVNELAAYLTSYILPFVTLSAPSSRDLIAFGVFGLLLAAVYLQSSRLALNPWLFLCGLHVQEIRFDGASGLLVTRQLPAAGDDIELIRLSAGLWTRKRGSV